MNAREREELENQRAAEDARQKVMETGDDGLQPTEPFPPITEPLDTLGPVKQPRKLGRRLSWPPEWL